MKVNREPKVSVIIPTYNRTSFLKDAINSVLNQTYRDFELIVVDDGSTDDTQDLVSYYGQKIRYIYQNNQGRSTARNHGIEVAQGEYLAFLDSDDVWLPDKLSRQIPILDAASANTVLVHGYKQLVDEKLQPIRGWEKKLRYSYRLAEKGQETYENYLQKAYIFTSTVLIRRDAVLSIGAYDVNLQALEDLDFYLRLLIKGYTFIFISEPPLIQYRIHRNNTGSTVSNQSYLQVYEKHLKLVADWKESRRVQKTQTLLYQALASTHYRMREYKNVLDYWQKSLNTSWDVLIKLEFWKQYLRSWLQIFVIKIK